MSELRQAQLPEGWGYKTLESVCQIRPPKKEAKQLLKDNDLVSFVPMKALGIDKMYLSADVSKPLSKVSGSYTYFRDGDVLLAKITPCFENGKLGIANKLENGIGFGSSEFIVYRPKEELTAEYLYYFLNQPSFRKTGASQMTGAVGHKRIPKDFYEGYSIPIPPLETQKQVVAVLDKAFAAIDVAKANVEKNLQNAKELFQSKLNQIFTQKGDGWEETKIGSQIDLLSGFAFKSKEYVGESQGIKLLRGDNIVQGSFRWKDAKYWPKERLNEFDKFLLEDGDITLAMDRTWVKAGIKHAKVSADDPPCLLVQRVARLRCLESLNPGFLFFLLGSNLFEKYVLSIQTGLGVPHISGKQIQAFTFQKPEFKKQQEVVHNLNNLSDEVSLLLNKYQRKLQSLEDVRKSILQKAFAGELIHGGNDA